ncbi:DUF3604 domain-containing protein [Candidatus Marimicrobium litorale]|uniref:DUF3604 domain-containing protein n=1 Tax=Candidatus Marimicrobium litorale TaxID=2518991 RepID=A0ABT3T3X6_9GAMM|nr:DUF3604 domain-containing protein [Candidatus Marimicrobium litorale]MCX2976957.1 DUF3604 domain-containing protein [Candidatus Marimicrobium litorale]
MLRSLILTLSLLCLVPACGDRSLSDEANDFGGRSGSTDDQQLKPVLDLLDRTSAPPNTERNAYFGDLHVHTEYSFDAYSFGTTATPYDAYRFAQGEAIQHPSGYQIQLRTPLDFYAVTDHAMFLGLVKEAADTSTEFSEYAVAESVHDMNHPSNMGVDSVLQRVGNFAGFVPDTLEGIQAGTINEDLVNEVGRRAWLDIVEAADLYNTPGRFTTFVGYEYTTSSDDRGNLHRNVIFRGSDKLPALPFSRLNSLNPEDLWDWMDNLRDQGIESLAIPHNSNGSNGQMFKLVDWAGNPLDENYALQRMRNEPLVEITQIKGTSDTHPLLSPNDEWADFEIYKLRVGTSLPSKPDGSYVRQALKNGLLLEQQGITNPFQFGFVAASDTHVAATTDDESNFFSKAGILDGEPIGRGSVPASFLYGAVIKMIAPGNLKEVEGREYVAGSGFESWSASGIAGVWAEENTRESIYDAFRRKETFATSGPRIKVRFFAGNNFDSAMLDADDLIAQAYERGVPMGGELQAGAGAPTFLLWAAGDPRGTPLQRLQVVKGFIHDGEPMEKVYDVACSDGLSPGTDTYRCPDNGARVNLADCSTTNDVGDPELLTVWQDPEFDSEEAAFYYLRVLENPTCRWSTWDAIREGVEPRPDLPATLQERAWSAPIWVRKLSENENTALPL